MAPGSLTGGRDKKNCLAYFVIGPFFNVGGFWFIIMGRVIRLGGWVKVGKGLFSIRCCGVVHCCSQSPT